MFKSETCIRRVYNVGNVCVSTSVWNYYGLSDGHEFSDAELVSDPVNT